MFSNKIEFIAPQNYIELKDNYPEPAVKANIPNWFKKIKHSPDNKTVKGCMPFLDALTAGYILKMPVDFHIKHNVMENGCPITYGSSEAIEGYSTLTQTLNINKKDRQEIHPTIQVGTDSPPCQKNKNLPFHKILNPWVIKTPPGYSCLFVPPLNNTDDRFSIISGIVDTDTFSSQINFPFIVNGDKYSVLDDIIKKGTPYVQVIPFKREQWSLQIKSENEKKLNQFRYKWSTFVLNSYKNNWRDKKSWK